MRVAHLDRRSVLVRALRVVYGGVLIAIAVAALAIGGTLAVLQTSWGGRAVARFALARVNATIAGRIGLGRLAFRGTRVTLERLALRDPAGRLVADVERVDVAWSPSALLRRRVAVEALAIRRPRLFLVEDAGELNLTRALASRAPTAKRPARPEPQGKPSRLVVEVRGWEVTGGVVEFQSGGPGARRRVRVDDVRIGGMLQLAGERLAVDTTVDLPSGHLELRGVADLSPAKGPIALEGRLEARLPGARVTANGVTKARRVDLRLAVDATDLAATAQAVEPLLGAPLPAIMGRGRIDATVTGSAAAPSLRAGVDVPALRVGANRIRALTGSVWLPDLGRPEAIDVELHADTAALGGKLLRSPSVALHAVGRRLEARAHVAAPQLTLALTGRRRTNPPASRDLTIESLTLEYPEARWTLARPARLSLARGRLGVSGLAVTAQQQKIEVDLAQTRRGVAGRLVVTALDVARLPRVLAPPALRLGGRLDATVHLGGRAAAPEVDVQAALDGGRIRNVRDIGVRLDARAVAGRARGHLEAHALGTALEARFDLPLRWPPTRRAPTAVDLQLAETDLAPTLQALEAATGVHLPTLRGRARLSAQVSGSADAPALALTARGEQLVLGGRPLGAVGLEVHGDGDRPLEASLEATGPPSASHARLKVSLSTPLSLRALLRRPPTAEALAHTPIELRGNIDRFPLALLATLDPSLNGAAGALSAELALSGPALEPTGTLAVDVTGATSAALKPTDGRLEVTLERSAVEVHARILRKGRPLLATEVRIGDSPLHLRSSAALAAAPLHVRAVVGPFTLKRHPLQVGMESDKPQAVEAIVHADLAVDGSLSAPRALFHGDVQGFRADKSPAGDAHVEATYADRKAGVNARLGSTGGGSAELSVTTNADLGYPAVAHGLDPRRLPLTGHLEAKGFDLASLSGLVPGLPEIGGRLAASARGRGTLATPIVEGRLEWKEGTLALTGLGRYHDIRLAMHGDEHKVVLDELVGKSGGGRARITGDAARDGDRYRLSAHGDVTRFPVYAQGQPVARVTVDAAIAGDVTPAATNLEVKVQQAKIELTDDDRRDLQSLDAPPDVVLVENGKPKGRAQADKLRALQTPAGARAAPAEQRPEPAQPHGPRPVRITVSAPHNLWVAGRDANLELGLGPKFHLAIDGETRVFGQVVVQRGRVDVLGRRFDLKQDSTLQWTGAPELPELDVTAQYDNREEGVTVLVTIKGPPGNTTVTVSSPNRPDLASSQLYALIITGHLQRGAGGAADSGSFSGSSEAASLAAGFVASRLQGTLAKRLPLDVLTIDPGNGATLTGTQVEAGRYMTKRLYVGYVARVGAVDPNRPQNRNAVHAEYRLTSRWEIEGEYGDAGMGSADVVWKKNY